MRLNWKSHWAPLAARLYSYTLLFGPNALCVMMSSLLGGASLSKKCGFFVAASIPAILIAQLLPIRLFRWMLLLPAFLLAAEIQSYWELHEGVSVGLLASVAASTRSEVFEFLRQRWWLPALSIASCAMALNASFSHFRIQHNFHRKIAMTLLFLLIFADTSRRIFSVGIANGTMLEISLLTRSWPIGVYLRGAELIQMHQETTKILQARDGFRFHAKLDSTTPQNAFVILVIGESSRKANWRHYGYTRNTSPILDQLPDIFWLEKLQAPGNFTMHSVPQLLTRATSDSFQVATSEKSILSAAREAGYGTAWISTQWSSGGMVPQLLAIARDADSVIDAETGTGGDELALPVVMRFLNRPGRQMIVLHQHGSHSDYIQRSHKNRKLFQPEGSLFSGNREAVVNAYDNSIVETDHVLSKLIEMIRVTRRPAAVVYTSDHGENLMDDSRNLRLHGSGSPTTYELEVPAFIWLSPQFQASLGERLTLLSQRCRQQLYFQNIQATLVDIAGIRSPLLEVRFSLFSGVFRQGNPKVILPDGSVQ